MSKNRRGRGSVQGNHNTRYNNRGNRGGGGYRNNSSHLNYRDNRDTAPIKPEGIYHNHSILAALSHLVGRTVHVRSKNDSIYEGIFCTISPKAAFVLKCVHKIEKNHANGFNGTMTQPIPHRENVLKEVVFDFHDIISITGKIDRSTKDVKGDGFIVDAEVGKRRNVRTERKELQKWTDGNDLQESMDEMSLDNGNNGWTYEDMIRTNEEKFNVSSMYDESMQEYTVPVPECDEETRQKAAKLADDIEKKVTSNVHIAEERGQIVPLDITEEERYSAVLRPGTQYIEITEPRNTSGTADIPAPLSQVDEPTEDMFKEEKEAAALKKQHKEVIEPPVVVQTLESKKCVVETQTEPASPKTKPSKIVPPVVAPSQQPAAQPVAQPASQPASQPTPQPTSQPTSPRSAFQAPVECSIQPTPKSEPATQVQPTVQHIATQVVTAKKSKDPEEVAQKQIMKSERSNKDRKEGLINFKNNYEDATQTRGPKIPATVAQTSAHPQLSQQVPQQPVAAHQPHSVAAHHTHQHTHHPKQRNDSMSSESSYTMQQSYQQHRHSVGHIQGVYNPMLQQQQQQQMLQMQAAQQMHIQQLQHQHQQHQQHQLHMQHQQQQHMQHQQQAAANNQHMPPPQQFAGGQPANMQQAYQMQQHMAAVQHQRQHAAQHMAQHQSSHTAQHEPQPKPSNLNPDAMEFKPGSSATSSPLPPAIQPGQPQSKPVMMGPDNKSVVVLPQPVAVIPAQMRQADMAVLQPNAIQGGAIIPQYGAHGPSLLIYQPNAILPRGYIGPAVSMAAMQHNPNIQIAHQQNDNNQAPTGMVSPSSPSSQQQPQHTQILYHPHPQQQIASQAQYMSQSQLHPQVVPTAHSAHLLQIQQGQVPAAAAQSGAPYGAQSGGPYANPLQPHTALFSYSHPPNVG